MSIKTEPLPKLAIHAALRSCQDNVMLKGLPLSAPLGSCRKVSQLPRLQHVGSMFCPWLFYGASTLSVDPLAIAGPLAPLLATSSGMGAAASGSTQVVVLDLRRGD